MTHTKRRWAVHTAIIALFSLGLLMCSSDGDEDQTIDASSGRATGGSGNRSSSSSGGSGNTTSSTGGNSTVIPTDACTGDPSTDAAQGQGEGGAGSDICVGVGQEAEAFPVDVLLVMDRSKSMGYEVSDGVTRLDLLSQAIQSFASDPDTADTDIRVGIVFFRATEGDVCDVASYETPDVPIGPLSENADDLAAAIESIAPGGLTPVVRALEGAVNHARQHAEDNTDRATVVALVSDGFPTECNDGPDDLTTAAEDAYDGDPSIPVYAIGVGANAAAKLNLDNLARAGGTSEAIMTEDGTAAEDFAQAMHNITLSDLVCEFTLPDPPEGMELETDPNNVNVQMLYTPFDGETEEMPYVGSLAGCGASPYGGWYFNDSSEPTSIRVCPCTCSRFGAGTLEIRIGCAPEKYIT